MSLTNKVDQYKSIEKSRGTEDKFDIFKIVVQNFYATKKQYVYNLDLIEKGL